MPGVPKTKKKSSMKSAAPRVNKSKWIRDQPATMSAKDVVLKAKGQGIKLSPAQVYTARSTANKRGANGKLGRRKGQRGASPAVFGRKGAAGKGDLRHEFVRIAMRIGTDEAQVLLDRIVDVQTGMSGSAG
jgi:hypothetical protein